MDHFRAGRDALGVAGLTTRPSTDPCGFLPTASRIRSASTRQSVRGAARSPKSPVSPRSALFDHYSAFALGVGPEWPVADEGGGPRALPPIKGHPGLAGPSGTYLLRLFERWGIASRLVQAPPGDDGVLGGGVQRLGTRGRDTRIPRVSCLVPSGCGETPARHGAGVRTVLTPEVHVAHRKQRDGQHRRYHFPEEQLIAFDQRRRRGPSREPRIGMAQVVQEFRELAVALFR